LNQKLKPNIITIWNIHRLCFHSGQTELHKGENDVLIDCTSTEGIIQPGANSLLTKFTLVRVFLNVILISFVLDCIIVNSKPACKGLQRPRFLNGVEDDEEDGGHNEKDANDRRQGRWQFHPKSVLSGKCPMTNELTGLTLAV